MNDLIPITHDDVGLGMIQTVDARALHTGLESKRLFGNWIEAKVLKNPIYTENQDYILLNKFVKQKGRGGHNKKDYVLLTKFGEQTGRGGRNKKDYALTIDTAKKVAMSEQTIVGNRYLDYFFNCKIQDPSQDHVRVSAWPRTTRTSP